MNAVEITPPIPEPITPPNKAPPAPANNSPAAEPATPIISPILEATLLDVVGDEQPSVCEKDVLSEVDFVFVIPLVSVNPRLVLNDRLNPLLKAKLILSFSL